MGEHCSDYINNLNDYLDGEISPELCKELETHIGHCNNCRIMVDSLKQTVSLCREGKEESLPKTLEDKLTNLLREKWNKKFHR